MQNSIKKFIKEEDGLTMVEYAIAGSLVGLACVLAFTQLGDAIGAAIQRIITVLTPAP